MAATLAAGTQIYEMYEELDKHDAAMVGGANPCKYLRRSEARLLINHRKTVGVMGWFTGGGHGPLSSDYGMGADNVLEATVVNPLGEIVVTNACEHPDLFYAIRGGGGGTFGVVVTVAMRAHPTPQTTHHTLMFNSRSGNLSAKFWDVAAFVHSEMPRLKDGGMQGYFGLRSPTVRGERSS